jgi:hypothetical protein
MSTSTVYDVKIKYALDDGKASKNASTLAGNLDKAGASAFSLKGALAAVGGAALLMKAKSALIDFNSEIDSMKINLSTIMQLQLKMPFEKANIEANKLFDTFQEMAKKSPATTKDFLEMASAIAAPIAMLGGGPDKLAKLTQGAVIAGQAFGERADIVALDVKQMLMGTITARDRVAQQLIASEGMSSEQFNALGAKDRANKTEAMLTSPTLKKAADAMGESMKGQVSTLEDQLQITLGQVGRPLMEGITAEVKKWNGWIEKHPRLIASYVKDFAGMLTDAFSFIKNTAGWLVENKELLFAIGKTFLAFKGAQLGTQVFKRMTDSMGLFAGNVKGMASSIGGIFSKGGSGAVGGGILGGFSKMVPVIGGVILGFQLLTGALDLLRNWLHKESDDKAKGAASTMAEAVGGVSGNIIKRKSLKARLADKNSTTRDQDQAEYDALTTKINDPMVMGEALRNLAAVNVKNGGTDLSQLSMGDWMTAERHLPSTYSSTDSLKTAELGAEANMAIEAFKKMTVEAKRDVLKVAFPDRWGQYMPSGTPDPTTTEFTNGVDPKKADVNITINRVEVASEDPDRFVFGLVKIADNAMKNKTASQHTTSGGF